jgi:stage II sporulation protein D
MLLVYPAAFAQDVKQDIIRVCVLKGADSLRLTLDGAYRIYSRDNELIKEGKSLYRARVAAAREGLMLQDKPLGQDAIRIKSDKDGRIYIDKWRFRGEVDIIKTPDLKLMVVNHLDMEAYLYGVLYHEVSHHWPYGVLKAQAIAARTYALYQKGVMKDKDYDVTADIYSQVYGGRANEKYRTNRAVDLTKGKIMIYKGEIFPAYFHATCGGFTEDATNLWKINLGCLKGVECKFCKSSRHFNWKRKIRLTDLEAALARAGYTVKGITDIKIESRNRSNRINNLIITSASGDLKIPGKDFRMAVGPNLLRSNNYDVNILGDTAVFKGIGWGHGVGMCQWGAYFMARKNWKAEKILEYYYPGIRISYNYGVKSSPKK